MNSNWEATLEKTRVMYESIADDLKELEDRAKKKKDLICDRCFDKALEEVYRRSFGISEVLSLPLYYKGRSDHSFCHSQSSSSLTNKEAFRQDDQLKNPHQDCLGNRQQHTNGSSRCSSPAFPPASNQPVHAANQGLINAPGISPLEASNLSGANLHRPVHNAPRPCGRLDMGISPPHSDQNGRLPSGSSDFGTASTIASGVADLKPAGQKNEVLVTTNENNNTPLNSTIRGVKIEPSTCASRTEVGSSLEINLERPPKFNGTNVNVEPPDEDPPDNPDVSVQVESNDSAVDQPSLFSNEDETRRNEAHENQSTSKCFTAAFSGYKANYASEASVQAPVAEPPTVSNGSEVSALSTNVSESETILYQNQPERDRLSDFDGVQQNVRGPPSSELSIGDFGETILDCYHRTETSSIQSPSSSSPSSSSSSEDEDEAQQKDKREEEERVEAEEVEDRQLEPESADVNHDENEANTSRISFNTSQKDVEKCEGEVSSKNSSARKKVVRLSVHVSDSPSSNSTPRLKKGGKGRASMPAKSCMQQKQNQLVGGKRMRTRTERGKSSKSRDKSAIDVDNSSEDEEKGCDTKTVSPASSSTSLSSVPRRRCRRRKTSLRKSRSNVIEDRINDDIAEDSNTDDSSVPPRKSRRAKETSPAHALSSEYSSEVEMSAIRNQVVIKEVKRSVCTRSRSLPSVIDSKRSFSLHQLPPVSKELFIMNDVFDREVEGSGGEEEVAEEEAAAANNISALTEALPTTSMRHSISLLEDENNVIREALPILSDDDNRENVRSASVPDEVEAHTSVLDNSTDRNISPYPKYEDISDADREVDKAALKQKRESFRPADSAKLSAKELFNSDVMIISEDDSTYLLEKFQEDIFCEEVKKEIEVTSTIEKDIESSASGVLVEDGFSFKAVGSSPVKLEPHSKVDATISCSEERQRLPVPSSVYDQLERYRGASEIPKPSNGPSSGMKSCLGQFPRNRNQEVSERRQSSGDKDEHVVEEKYQRPFSHRSDFARYISGYRSFGASYDESTAKATRRQERDRSRDRSGNRSRDRSGNRSRDRSSDSYGSRAESRRDNDNHRKSSRDRSSERETEFRRGTGRDTRRDSSREAGRHPKRDYLKDTDRDTVRDYQKDTDRDIERDFSREAGRDTMRDSSRKAGRDTNRDSQRDTGRDTARDSSREPGSETSIDLRREPGQYSSIDQYREPSRNRLSESRWDSGSQHLLASSRDYEPSSSTGGSTSSRPLSSSVSVSLPRAFKGPQTPPRRRSRSRSRSR